MQTPHATATPKAIYPSLHTIPPEILRILPKSAICIAREIQTLIHISGRVNRQSYSCQPSQTYLAKKTGYRRETVNRSLKILRKHQVLSYFRRTSHKVGRFLTNVYTIGKSVWNFGRSIINRLKERFTHVTSLQQESNNYISQGLKPARVMVARRVCPCIKCEIGHECDDTGWCPRYKHYLSPIS